MGGLLEWRRTASKIPVPLLGTHRPQYRSFSFYIEVLHWKGDSICAPRSLQRCCTWDVVFIHFSNILAAFAAFHSFSCSEEHVYRGLRGHIHGATRHTKVPFFARRGSRSRWRHGGTTGVWFWLQSLVSRGSLALQITNTIHCLRSSLHY